MTAQATFNCHCWVLLGDKATFNCHCWVVL
jgi:hypothetical protein